MAATGEPATSSLSIEVFSDVVCPWCYIGTRRFDAALAELDADPDIDVATDVSVAFRAFMLDPTAPPGAGRPVREVYAKKFGGEHQADAVIDRVTGAAAEDGLELRLDIARRANTLLAHRLLWWAERDDVPLDQATLNDALMRAYFVEGRSLGDPDVLADIVADLGTPRELADRFLHGDEGRDEVAGQLERAAELGITAVPTFVVNERFAIPGAQDRATFVRLLRRLLRR